MRCLVIGASKGIGLAITRGLSVHGNSVIGMSRNVNDDMALKEAKFFLPTSTWIPIDLSNSDSAVMASTQTALDALGGLDLLVISAGMGAMHTPFEENGDNARALMQTNYFGPIAVWRACARELLKSHGTAVFIGSTCADRPAPGLTLYRASKAALHAFALNQAHAYRHRIRVHVLAPGWVDTEMTAGLRPALKAKIASKIPAGRFATVHEVAAAFFMLLDNKEASIYQTHEDYVFTTERTNVG